MWILRKIFVIIAYEIVSFETSSFREITRMINRKFMISVFVILLVISVGIVPAEETEKMQYKLKLEKGQKYYFKLVRDEQVTEMMAGEEETIERTLRLGTDFDVNDIDEKGNAWVRFTLRWLSTTYKTPTMEFNYDSKDKYSLSPPDVSVFFAMLGESYSAKISPEGSVIEMKDVDRVRNNVIKKFAFAPMQEELEKDMEQIIGEEALKENIEQDFCIYPDKPVGVGDSWNKTRKVTQGNPVIAENKWLLKERSEGVATIEVVINIKTDPKPKEVGPMIFTEEVSGEAHGVIKIRESTGMIIFGNINTELSGVRTIQGGDFQKGQMSMSIPVRIIIVTDLYVSEREDEEGSPDPGYATD